MASTVARPNRRQRKMIKIRTKASLQRRPLAVPKVLAVMQVLNAHQRLRQGHSRAYSTWRYELLRLFNFYGAWLIVFLSGQSESTH